MLWARRARSLVSRLGYFIGDHRWIILTSILSVVGVITVWVPLPTYLNFALAAVALVLLAVEIRRYVRTRGRVSFDSRSADRFDDVEAALADSPRFEFWRAVTGNFVLDAKLSSDIANGRITATLAAEAYRVPPEIRELGEIFQRQRSATIDFYDGDVLGLDTDLGHDEVETTSISLVPAKYRDHLATDIFAMHDVGGGPRSQGMLGRRLFVDRRNRLRDFHSSWLLNAVGTSAIAFTTDGRLVAVDQSVKNESSGGLLAPSGSGSLEGRDFTGTTAASFDKVLANGALRELREETGILASDIASHAFLGFGRWVNKSAKPEAFTLVFLSVDSHTVLRRETGDEEKPFSVRTRTLRVNLRGPDWREELADTAIEDTDLRRRLSLPLWAGLVLTARIARDPQHALHARVISVLGGS